MSQFLSRFRLFRGFLNNRAVNAYKYENYEAMDKILRQITPEEFVKIN
jgi:hypothetical protein